MKTLTRFFSVLVILTGLAFSLINNVSARYAEAGDAPSSFSSNSDKQEVEVYGSLEGMTASSLTISGWTVQLHPTTEWKTNLEIGDAVKVHAFIQPDGSLVAREVERLATPVQPRIDSYTQDDNPSSSGDDDGTPDQGGDNKDDSSTDDSKSGSSDDDNDWDDDSCEDDDDDHSSDPDDSDDDDDDDLG